MAILAFPSVAILDSTAAGRSLLTAASASAQRSLLGLGTLATQNGNIADYLTTASAATTYQPLDSDLTAIAALTTTTYGLSLLTQADAPTARTTLGLGTGDSPTFNGLTVGNFTVDSSGNANFASASNIQINRTNDAVGNSSLNLANAFGLQITATGSNLQINRRTGGVWSNVVTFANADGGMTLGGQTLTGSSATSLLNLSTTWNTTGLPTAILLNVTDTASQANSNLMDLRVGGVSMFRVTKLGQVMAQIQVDSNSSFRILNNNGFFSIGSTPDTFWFRDAANIFAQRNGVSPQTFRVYNTFTDSSNYERAKIAWESSVLAIGTEKAGTGAARALELQTDGVTRWNFGTDGSIYPGQNTTNTLRIFNQISGSGLVESNSQGLAFDTRVVNSTGGTTCFWVYGSNTSAGGGTHSLWRASGSFSPTTGSANYRQFAIEPTINQTGGANGITRGIHINPTLTAAADFRAIESSNGSVVLTDTYAAGSGSLAGSLLNLTQTWNTTGTPTAISLNVTDTASNAASLLMDLRLGGTSRLSVSKSGAVVSQATIVAAGNLQSNGGSITTLWSGGSIGWSPGGTADLTLFRDAANILAQRNGVNAQAFRVYNTFTDSSNNERAKFAWESNILRIGTEKLGTGAARALELQTDGTTRLTLATNGTATFSSSITVGPDASAVMIWFAAGQAFRVAGSVTSTTSLFFDVPRLFFRDMSNGYANSLSIVNSDIGIGTNAPTERFEVSGGKTLLAASTTSKASLNIPSGSDPTSPNNGDIWQNSNLLKVRLNGRTQTLSYQITSGTAAPSGGSDGDIYLQYT